MTSLGPTPELVAVRVGNGTRCAPKPGDAFCVSDVNLRPLVVLQFDRIMAVSSSSRANFKIVSGTSGNLAFIQPRVDPVERTIVFTLATPLAADTEYRLLIEDSKRPADRLAAFDGAPFEGRAVVRFTTGKDATEQTDVDPQRVDACAAVATLKDRCGNAACHGPRETHPAMGLSLDRWESIFDTAINHGSKLVQQATEPAGTGEGSRRFPAGLPIIAPGASGRSFLLFKILMDPRRTGPDGPPHPSLALDTATATDPFARTAAELAQRVPGAPMPRDLDPLPVESLRVLRRWIDDGAKACGASSSDAGIDATADVASDGEVGD